MKSYLSYFRIRFITNLQYRMDAIAGITTQIFFGLIFIMVYLAFYESGGENLPMNYSELVTYLWLSQAFFALIFPYERDNELLGMIKNGNLAYELIRPQDFYFKWYIKMISKKLVATLLRFGPVIILGIILPYPFHLSGPKSLESFIIFIISLILALLLVTSLSLCMHILTMFMLDEKGPITLYSVVADLFMGAVVPIPFFPGWLQKISSFLPFRYITDFPFRIYSGSIPISEGYNMLILSFIWIIITIFIGHIVSRVALRKAVIQGG